MAQGSTITRIEPWLFAALASLQCSPIVTSAWFPTLDGPSHLNNARLMADLVLGRGRAAEFFALNPFPEPNLLGHLVMSMLMMVAPAWLAEKAVLLLASAGLAFAFRRLVTKLAPERPWASLLILPFLCAFPFYMGFLNFCLSIPLLLLALAAWEDRLAGGSPTLSLIALFLLTYLAHLSTFCVLLALVGGRTGWHLFIEEGGHRRKMGQLIGVLTGAVALPLILAVAYFVLHHGHAAKPVRYETGELLTWILDGRAWITLSYDAERMWTMAMAMAQLVLFFTCVLILMRKSDARGPQVFWLLCSVGMLLLYLILPDSMAGGSHTSPRLLFFTMLIAAVFVAMVPCSRWIRIAALVLSVVASTGHLLVKRKDHAPLIADLHELMAVSNAVPQGAVLLPLNYGDNWMHSNFSSYLGAARGAIVLDNFVATAPFAPVRWKQERLPYQAIGNFDQSARPCVRIDAYRTDDAPLVDMVLTWRMGDAITDSCSADVRRQLSSGFQLVASSPTGDARLYRRN